jgi:protein-S-isoprenylcysteine O-methyltransferase Ste14
MQITKYQKLFGVGQVAGLIGLAILGLLYLLDRMLSHVPITGRPESVRIAGGVLVVVGICWYVWCMKAITQWWHHDRLCTSGPFKFVRHPIYAGSIWFWSLGISLLFNSWIVLTQPVFSFLVTSLLVRKEEKMMESVFGREYQQYAAQKGRLFPRIL